ncbi:MAG TPA: nucleotide sugar dehydrogenase [Acidobacteriota bacterium]|nr:nucleotide sugar dehydrogenase [Acidobacteriota bacterium]
MSERKDPINGSPHLEEFLRRAEEREALVGVVGLGYVGLPLAVEVCASGFRCLGLEVSREVVDRVNEGRSHVQDVADESLAPLAQSRRFQATCDYSRLGECDALAICVPTPLNKIKDPDLSYVAEAGKEISRYLRPGQLVVLESTTFPGTTREVLLDLLQESGLSPGRDFFLCYSPERVDPGNKVWNTRNTPKVIGGLTPECLRAGVALYQAIFDQLVPVSSTEAAELIKVYENTFRMINIALANEVAQVCERLGVDVWEVIEAAATKPFGFMKFTPGPGLGGHCVPLDPHYLSWKMRALSFKTRMIELASEINSEMPAFVVRKISDALNSEAKPVKGSRLLVVGAAYKPEVDDLRESPALEILRLLREMGGEIGYHDPYIPQIDTSTYGWSDPLRLENSDLTPSTLEDQDAVVIVTHHGHLDYQMILDNSRLVVDTRGVTRGLTGQARVVALAGQSRPLDSRRKSAV